MLQAQRPTDLGHLEGQVRRVRQGVTRLIDSYSEELIDKEEFEPRITRMRERLSQLEAQAQQARDEASLEQELMLLLSRLEDFVAQVKTGLHAADWLTRREIIRALVKRVEVEQQQVRVVFRIGPLSPHPPSGKETQSLQHCRRRDVAILGRASFRWKKLVSIERSSFEPSLDASSHLGG